MKFNNRWLEIILALLVGMVIGADAALTWKAW